MQCLVCEAPRCCFFLKVEDKDYWRCDRCCATFLDPAQMPDAESEVAQYRLHENDPDDAGYRGFLQRLAGPLRERLAPGARGLDYGCGPGPALAAMLGESGHPTAVYDPFFAADLAALESQYDFVTSSETVEHFHRPAEEFRRLQKLVRPGGWLGIMTCFQTDDARFASWHYRRDPTHVVFYREATFRQLAADFGWSCEIPTPNVALLQRPKLP